MSSSLPSCQDSCHGNCAHGHSVYDQTLDEIKFESSIFNSCVVGDMEKVRKLITQKGACILGEQDKNGYTCLHYAARNSHFDICKLLIERGINVNVKTFSCESTALHRASFIGHAQIVELLLDNRANSLERDCDGKTALHKCVEQYLQRKANPFESKKYVDTMKLLVRHNSSILKVSDTKSMTPLDYCPDLALLLE